MLLRWWIGLDAAQESAENFAVDLARRAGVFLRDEIAQQGEAGVHAAEQVPDRGGTARSGSRSGRSDPSAMPWRTSGVDEPGASPWRPPGDLAHALGAGLAGIQSVELDNKARVLGVGFQLA